MKTVQVKDIQEVLDNPASEYVWDYLGNEKGYLIEAQSVFNLSIDINSGNLYRVVEDERIAELEEEKLSVEHESLKAERDVLQEKLLNALDVLRVNGLGAYVDRIRGVQR